MSLAPCPTHLKTSFNGSCILSNFAQAPPCPRWACPNQTRNSLRASCSLPLSDETLNSAAECGREFNSHGHVRNLCFKSSHGCSSKPREGRGKYKECWSP